jgi:succinylglutamic semialdehyde dehydrogenase
MLAEHFGKYPQKLLALEMGGNNPLIIGKVSNYEAASILIIQSAFLTAGQRCTCARRLIVPKGKPGDDLLKTFLEITTHVRIGAYTDTPEPFMGPVIDLHASKNLLSTQNAMRSMGGKVLMEMKELRRNTPLLSPAVIDVTAMKVRADEEYFGPLLQVFRADSFEDAIKEANNTSFGLCAGILTEEKSEYETFYSHSRAGVVNWNSQTTGASSRCPFGGVGKSGNFRPSAYYAADYCNYPVASIESSELKMPDKLPPG